MLKVIISPNIFTSQCKMQKEKVSKMQKQQEQSVDGTLADYKL